MSETKQKLDEIKADVEAKLKTLKQNVSKDVENSKIVSQRKLYEIRAELEAMVYDTEDAIEAKLKKIGPRIEEAKAHYQEVEDYLEQQYKGMLGCARKLWRFIFG